MIGEVTTPKRRHRFLQHTDSDRLIHEENHRLLCVAERYPREI
jgi:hypothetical protein